MMDAVKDGRASPLIFSMFADDIAIYENKLQIYGAVVGMHKFSVHYHVEPLEDPDNVDSRRKSIGLGPLASYVKKWGIIWDVERYKKNIALYESQRTSPHPKK